MNGWSNLPEELIMGVVSWFPMNKNEKPDKSLSLLSITCKNFYFLQKCLYLYKRPDVVNFDENKMCYVANINSKYSLNFFKTKDNKIMGLSHDWYNGGVFHISYHTMKSYILEFTYSNLAFDSLKIDYSHLLKADNGVCICKRKYDSY